MPKPIRVFLVDTHSLLRDVIKRMVLTAPCFDVVGDAAEGRQAIEEAPPLKPDVLVTAVSMPGISCFDAIRRIRPGTPATRFLIFTAYPPSVYLREALEVHVQGCVTKEQGFDLALVDAITDIHRGRLYFDLQCLRWLEPDGDYVRMRDTPEPRPSGLSRKERRLLFDLTHGISASASSTCSGPSRKIPSRLEAALMQKLGFYDRRRLARYADLEWLVDWW